MAEVHNRGDTSLHLNLQQVKPELKIFYQSRLPTFQLSSSQFPKKHFINQDFLLSNYLAVNFQKKNILSIKTS